MKMIKGKKGFGILLKIFVFVLVVIVVIGAFMNLWSMVKRATGPLLDKAKELEMQSNSYIHPDLSLATHNFWQNQFKNFVIAAVQTKDFNQGQGYCYGTFYTDPAFKNINDWTLTFLQEQGNIILILKDGSGTKGAEYPADKEKNELEGIKLCIRTEDGKEIDVDHIVIQFGQDQSYYVTEESLRGSGEEEYFYYQPYEHEMLIKKESFIFDFLNRDSKSSLYFYTYDYTQKKLCITPMEKKGKENSLSHKKIKSLLTDSDTGYPRYKAFCSLPINAMPNVVEEANRKTCFYTPCNYFDSHKIDGELESVDLIKETTCGRFSTGCGGICIPSEEVLINLGEKYSPIHFKCEPCGWYDSCKDFGKDNERCVASQTLCDMDCTIDVQTSECIGHTYRDIPLE
ncbi:hypothetical protein AYK26_01830 [Euryarchaeota archaeon SM23-78]|nr:MAG: hypothetical protein AYK26_01830 [Euryarchaeota archaeon SM23-78]MBW3000343.1 hypothetical protein [Candidatus Woesearchaeota archaeon]